MGVAVRSVWSEGVRGVLSISVATVYTVVKRDSGHVYANISIAAGYMNKSLVMCSR